MPRTTDHQRPLARPRPGRAAATAERQHVARRRHADVRRAPPRCPRRGQKELLVTNSTRWPAARRRAMASAEPGIGWWASQITPSRSQMHEAGSDVRRAMRRRRHRLPMPLRHGHDACQPCHPTGVPRFEPFPGLRYDATAVAAGRRRRAALRRAQRGRPAGLRRPPRAQHRARRRARWRPTARAATTSAGQLLGRVARRRDAASTDAAPTFTLYRMALHRRGRPGPRHGRRDRRAGGRRRPGRGRRAAPRAHHAEGQHRPPRPDPGHGSQPVADLGSVAGRRADRRC